MKLSQMSRLLAAAFVSVALFGGEAFAQAEFTPALTVTATGNSVDIRWTAIGVAPSYELVAGTTAGGSNVAAVTLPAALMGASPRLVVTAPNGGYYLRVRAAAGGTKGPWSNEVYVAVGLQPCVPGTTPTLTATPDGNNVNVSWTAVPGASTYILRWSRTAGITELAETVSGTSASKFVGMNGTFFVKVEAVTSCGNTISNEASFTIAVTRRFLSAGEILNTLRATASNYPRAFLNAHTYTSERYDYIILACRALYQQSGGTVGCNWRRAVPGDLSMDGLSVENPADNRYYFADVIAGAGGPNPVVWYEHPFHDGALLRDSSGRYAPHGFANPMTLKTYVNYGAAGGW